MNAYAITADGATVETCDHRATALRVQTFLQMRDTARTYQVQEVRP